MKERPPARPPTTALATPAAARTGLLQRRCACGGAPGPTGECAECRAKRLTAPRRASVSSLRIQTKLEVGTPGDRYEEEAERVAERVMRAPDDGRLSHPPSPIVQAGGAGGAAPTAGTGIEEDIRSLRGTGRPLPTSVRDVFEPRFGHDFSRVRIHADDRASRIARAIGAHAFTLGSDIFFEEGRYSPEGPAGQRLLAHELTHVVQQVPHVARQEAQGDVCSISAGTFREGEGFVDKERNRYVVVGTWRKGDTADRYWRRVFGLWITWRFGKVTPDTHASMLEVVTKARGTVYRTIPPVPGCQYQTIVAWDLIGSLDRMVGRDRTQQAENAASDEPGVGATPEPVPASETEEAPEEAKDAAEPGNEGAKAGGGPAIVVEEAKEAAKAPQTIGSVQGAAEEEEERKREPAAPIRQDAAVLQDPRIALNYLQILEHFAGRTISVEDKTAAADGLSQAELDAIVAGAPMRRLLTALYTQGYREFQAAKGTDVNAFFKLEETIVEQFVRGNPTATRNHLRIGYGIPEKNVLGIVHRASGILLYDDNGFPLPGLGGVGMRDKGHIGARQDPGFGINIAEVEDVGLRMFLNSLRQTFGDPTRMTAEAAGKLFDNLEQVRVEVERGLSAEIKKQFEEGLPYFIGFLAGHGLSNFLMRSPNHVMIGIGLALQGLLRAAEYLMSIDAAAGAMERLNKAAYHISRIEVDEQGKLTALSQQHIQAAAGPIREMVVEIAITVGTLALGRLIRAARSGERPARIDCTTCTLKEASPKPAEVETAAPKAGEQPKAAESPKPGEPSSTLEGRFSALEMPKAPEPAGSAAVAKAAGPPPALEGRMSGLEMPKTADAPPKDAETTGTAGSSSALEGRFSALEVPKAKAEPAAPKAADPPKATEPPPALKEKMSGLQQERLRLEQELAENRAKKKELSGTVSKEHQSVRDLLAAESKASPEQKPELRRKAREANERRQQALQKLDELASEEGIRKDLDRVQREIEKTDIQLNPQDHRAALPCFSGDTLVRTAEGPRRIDRLRAGEVVYAFDLARDRLVKRRVVEVFENRTRHFYELGVGGDLIRATGQHRFRVEGPSAWVAARDLRPGMRLRSLDGGTVALDSISLRENLESATYNLSVEQASNYFVGPGVLVHNQGVDLGLGNTHVIYRGTNPDFPGKVYVGQTTVLDAEGKPRGTSARQGEHRDFAQKQLRLHAEGKLKLRADQVEFYRFMSKVTLEPIVRGIATREQADFLEQRNMDIERKLRGEDSLMNRREQIKSEGHMREVTESIMKDQKVQAAGYCPR